MDLYAENILDHYKHPHHHGALETPTISASDANPLCGDKVQIDLKIEDGKIIDVGFSGEGCAISLASTSMLMDEIIDKKTDEAFAFTNENIYEMLGVPLTTARVKCALLGLVTLKKALTVYKLSKQ